VEVGTVDALLSEIFEPLGANYLILGERLILVTDAATAENYRTVEIFSLIDAKGEKPTLNEARKLVAEMKQAIAPASWKETLSETGQIGRNGEVLTEESGANGETPLRNANETATNETVNGIGGIGEELANAQNSQLSEDAENNAANEEPSIDGETVDAPDAVAWLDVEAACLIVRQSQPNQRALRRWLNARLANPTNSTNINDNVEQTDEKKTLK
jgi:hypothetical protein